MRKSSAIIQLLVVGTLMAGGTMLYYTYPAYAARFYPACIFHRMTGLFCPGCGSQRAASALLHGHLARAASFNILFLLFLPVILYSAVAFTWNVFSNRAMSQRLFQSPAFVKSVLIVVLAFAVLRNIPVAPFSWLAPH